MPSSILDKLRGILRRPQNTTADLAVALDDARRAEVDATAAVQTQTDVVARGFLDDDTKRARDRTALEDLRLKATDAQAILAELVRRHAAAAAADEDARRRVAYDAAKAQAAAASADLLKIYPRATRDLVALLGRLAQAQQAVAQANEDLPSDAVPLADPEMAVRSVASLPRQVIAEETVELWSRVDMTTPVDAEFQDTIYSLDKNGSPSGWGRRADDLEPCFRLRQFRKLQFRHATNGDYPHRLAASIRLPHLIGGGMAFGNSFLMHDPALAASMAGEDQPEVVLAKVAAMDAATPTQPRTVERPLVTEFELLGDVVPLEAPKPTTDTVSRRADAKPAPVRFGSSPMNLPARAGRR